MKSTYWFVEHKGKRSRCKICHMSFRSRKGALSHLGKIHKDIVRGFNPVIKKQRTRIEKLISKERKKKESVKQSTRSCKACYGSGKFPNQMPCFVCEGKGFLFTKDTKLNM